ncbi:MAG: acetate/propionate family kinase [Acidobacteriia bacterium]|nr:acetate/propionate family kinase [Terriglobia bacterium]
MKVLVLNPGSSSLRYALISADPPSGDQVRGEELLSGVLEPIRDHAEAAAQLFARMQWTAADFDLMALRVVQGGDLYLQPTKIDDRVVANMVELEDLAPLHNASSVAVFRAFQQAFQTGSRGGVPAVAIFDSSFHRTIPAIAYTYAIPHKLAAKHKIRRYGFHGISHNYLMLRYAEMTGTPLAQTNIITLHLGGGCSATAIKNGESVDTSMGFTPLEGLVMGTRSGDLDPALVGFLARKENISAEKVELLLNTQSGLLGISDISQDMRVLTERAKTDERARLALDVFCYRVKKYVGAYLAAMGGAAAIVFSGGIGEGASGIRQSICEGLENLGLELDPVRNADGKGERRITREGSRMHAYVIPTDEGLMMAHLALRWCG